MKPNYSDCIPTDFYTEDGRINLEALETREHHLCALSVCIRTLDGIAEQIADSKDTDSEWHKRATSAHKSWHWMLCRVRERIAILNARERNIKMSRSILIRKHLIQELKKHVPRSVYKECDRIARKLAREEASESGAKK